MCEPKAGSGLMILDLLLGTKAGRRTIGTAITAGALYASTQMAVTVVLAVPLVLAAVAIAAVAAALLYRQRAMASAAVANATRKAQARIEVQRVPELEATRSAVDALPVVAVQEDA